MSIEALSTPTGFKPSSRKSRFSQSNVSTKNRVPRQLVIGLLLVFALLAFELFNFDTTRFALESLLGDARFLSLTWASILAIAFCAIDFAGLAKLFSPSRGSDESKEVWYLMGAWFLGATMNAVMTWWAVSLVMLNSQFGNELLSRQDMLRYVPMFVAALVWLTRILFIGALSVTGERLLYGRQSASRTRTGSRRKTNSLPKRAPVFSGSQAGLMPTLTPQPVELSAASPETITRGTFRRPSKPISSYSNPAAVPSMHAHGRS